MKVPAGKEWARDRRALSVSLGSLVPGHTCTVRTAWQPPRPKCVAPRRAQEMCSANFRFVC